MKFHSIRTRYTLATAAVLLALLFVFCVGGRFLLLLFVHDIDDLVLTLYTAFVATAGLFIVPLVFWIQSKLLLNPLTKMIDCIRQTGKHCDEADCPRLDWQGDDEFAELAFSVNTLLETISRRTMAISQVENRQKALINGLPDGLLIFDRQHRLVSIIKHPDGVDALPGLTEGQPIDPSIYGTSTLDALARSIDRVLEQGTVESLRLNTGMGRSARHFDYRITPTDQHFVLAIVRDISTQVLEHVKRLAAETRLSHTRKQESLTLLAGSIAHDMNNVLAAVNNTVEISLANGQSPEAVQTIRDAVKRGGAMTRELMTFAGETKFDFQPCNPADLILEAKRLAEGVLSESVNVTYDIPDDLPAVDADPNQTWKVFFNLIKNANEAMDGTGEISVSIRPFEMTEDLAENFTSSKPLKAGPGVLFCIDDTGPGIRPELVRRIFDPYVSTKSSGRGFGLAAVASIVDAHFGGIQLESHVGKGSSFRVFLPVSEDQPLRMPGLAAKNEAPHSQSTPAAKEILLVDDDETLLKTTSILLHTLNYTVHTALSHRDALDVCRRQSSKLACIIMDANLGKTDPVRLIAAFRSLAPSVPVIVSSGYAPAKIEEMFRQQPYDAFLAKPYTLGELKEKLEHL